MGNDGISVVPSLILERDGCESILKLGYESASLILMTDFFLLVEGTARLGSRDGGDEIIVVPLLIFRVA